jgi:hypothetical protein
MELQTYPREDKELAIRIFHKAIEIMKIPNDPTADPANEFLREDGSLDFEKVPVQTIRTIDGGSKFLHLAYVYDGFYTVDADYNPLIAILGFIDSARNHLKTTFPAASAEDIGNWTEVEAYKMTFSLLSRIYQRMDLAMRNCTDEVIANWRIEYFRWAKKVNTEHGLKYPPFQEKKFFRSVIKSYEEEIVRLWFNGMDRGLDDRKIQLAREYPSILKHWQKLRKDYVAGNEDWREYANAGKFFDTPMDLIDKLEDSTDISHLALEHAGRCAGLLNTAAKAEDLEKRQQEIMVTGYTPRQLNNFKKDGQKLFDEIQE